MTTADEDFSLGPDEAKALKSTKWWREEVIPLLTKADVDKRIYIIAPHGDPPKAANFAVGSLRKEGFDPIVANGADSEAEIEAALGCAGVVAIVSTVGTATEVLVLLAEIDRRTRHDVSPGAVFPAVQAIVPHPWLEGQFAKVVEQSYSLTRLNGDEELRFSSEDGATYDAEAAALILKFAGEMLVSNSLLKAARVATVNARPHQSEPERTDTDDRSYGT